MQKSLTIDYRTLNVIRTNVLSCRSLAMMMRRNSMPHISVLKTIVNKDHKGQKLSSVLKNLRVYLKLSNDYLASDSAEGRLLSVFKIHATSKFPNRLSADTLATVIDSSKKSLRVL